MVPEHIFRSVSGPSSWECHFLADRWDDTYGWSEDMGECWVGQVVGGQIHLLHAQTGWLTELWRSPAGCVYVTEASARRRGVHVSRSADPANPGWEYHDLECVPAGVWGLDDGLVFAWGPWGDENRMYRWDGSRWAPMPSPGRVVAVHGTRPDLIFAVGDAGLIAWWDGGRWIRMPFPHWSLLNGVFVVDESEVWACSFYGRLLEGSVYGWTENVFTGIPTYEIVKANGRVLVAAENDGLLELSGNRVDPIDPAMVPRRIEFRREILVLDERFLADVDGANLVRRVELAAFIGATRGIAPLWKPRVRVP